MPYRIDVREPPAHALDTLIDLGALDVESVDGGLAALMPDAVSPADIARALGVTGIHASPAVGRDDESVWTIRPRHVRTRTLAIVPADGEPQPGTLRIADRRAFGTGLHPTTALCLHILEDLLDAEVPPRMLDVGTGSGILALAALRLGVTRAVGLDTDAEAVRAAEENACLNGLTGRLSLVRGGPEAVRGSWPLVMANIRAAELMAMAPALARRTASHGKLVLSGIPRSVGADVEGAYRRVGMKAIRRDDRDGWTALVLHPSW